ncbi:hypothetical protein Pcinc_000116 [Petrolisthes cinctipes]|uniref:Uncharacterized protein n=1 Tax=Petrolisthes cinctipes TaxID=88211 RepID=A0AAE1GQF6_PETCI|nr:hypothetical protein Pcinc_000116 [Petrolisthes cinctipes]
MLVAWLTDNESQDWVAGIKFVQFQKNSSHHAGIKRSPYSALFGNEARVGLTTSSLPREILDNLESEHDLARLDLASAESPAPSTDTGLTSVEPTPLASSLDEPAPTASSSDEPASTASSSDEPAPNAFSSDEPAPTATSSAETGPSSTDTTSISSESAPPSATETDNDLAVHVERIKRALKAGSAGQLSQAERMVKRSKVDFKSGEVGDNVAVPVPLVDRGRVCRSLARWLLSAQVSDEGKNSHGTTRASPNTISARETCSLSLGDVRIPMMTQVRWSFQSGLLQPSISVSFRVRWVCSTIGCWIVCRGVMDIRSHRLI